MTFFDKVILVLFCCFPAVMVKVYTDFTELELRNDVAFYKDKYSQYHELVVNKSKCVMEYDPKSGTKSYTLKISDKK